VGNLGDQRCGSRCLKQLRFLRSVGESNRSDLTHMCGVDIRQRVADEDAPSWRDTQSSYCHLDQEGVWLQSQDIRTRTRRDVVDQQVWQPALLRAKIGPTTRADGMHALRHLYASVLLDAGESIKALAQYLGHSDPGFTLRVYTHLMPTSHERTRKAIDTFLAGGERAELAA
jgi:hypothetical protein